MHWWRSTSGVLVRLVLLCEIVLLQELLPLGLLGSEFLPGLKVGLPCCLSALQTLSEENSSMKPTNNILPPSSPFHELYTAILIFKLTTFESNWVPLLSKDSTNGFVWDICIDFVETPFFTLYLNLHFHMKIQKIKK